MQQLVNRCTGGNYNVVLHDCDNTRGCGLWDTQQLYSPSQSAKQQHNRILSGCVDFADRFRLRKVLIILIHIIYLCFFFMCTCKWCFNLRWWHLYYINKSCDKNAVCIYWEAHHVALVVNIWSTVWLVVFSLWMRAQLEEAANSDRW